MMDVMYDTKISIRLDYIIVSRDLYLHIWLMRVEIISCQCHLLCDGAYEAGSWRFREIKMAKVSADYKIIGGRILVEHFEKKNPS
jgi:hypothetical protein